MSASLSLSFITQGVGCYRCIVQCRVIHKQQRRFQHSVQWQALAGVCHRSRLGRPVGVASPLPQPDPARRCSSTCVVHAGRGTAAAFWVLDVYQPARAYVLLRHGCSDHFCPAHKCARARRQPGEASPLMPLCKTGADSKSPGRLPLPWPCAIRRFAHFPPPVCWTRHH